MMKRKLLLIALIAMNFVAAEAKRYKFNMTHSYEVAIVRVAQEGTKYLKVWGVASSPDKAIDQAMQDAVAACIFTGIEGNQIAGQVPPLTSGKDSYELHKDFFDKFFKKGEFMNYVKNVNSNYPTGENNIICKLAILEADELQRNDVSPLMKKLIETVLELLPNNLSTPPANYS